MVPFGSAVLAAAVVTFVSAAVAAAVDAGVVLGAGVVTFVSAAVAAAADAGVVLGAGVVSVGCVGTGPSPTLQRSPSQQDLQ